MTSDAEDRSTWPRNGHVIRRDELLRLIEERGGPEGLDLRGAVFVGEGSSDNPLDNGIDLSPEALAPLVDAYSHANGGSNPPWLGNGGVIRLRGAQLRGANLTNAQLQGADFTNAELQGAALSDAGLQAGALSDAQLQGARLWNAQLRGAYLTGAQLQWADLSGAELQAAHICCAQLQGARLPNAQLQGADLSGAQLQGAYLWGAQLQEARLEGAWLHATDMYRVASLDGVHWHGALLDHTRMKRESLGEAIGDEIEAHKGKKATEYEEAKEAYLLLKNNFNQIGRYEDASWGYVKERQMQKMGYYWEWRPNTRGLRQAWQLLRESLPLFRPGHLREVGAQLWRLLRVFDRGSFWRWLLAWGTEALTKYGEDPWRPIVWAVGLAVGLFPLLFWTAGNLHYQNGASITAYWDAIAYSLTTFGTLSFNDLQPVGIGTRIISAIEAFTGVLLFALLVFTLANKMSRG
jgi:uncharacterized protein YjbI with pentapeptide repeats